MGGALVPGASLSGISWAHGSSVSIGQSPMAVPIGVLPDAGSFKAETFQVGDLLARGIAARPVTGGQNVMYGILGQGEVALRSGLSAKSTWSRRDGTATLQITWDSGRKREGQVVFQVFDIDNKMVEASKPGKIKVRAGELEISSWKLPVADLTQGVYRIGVLLGEEVVWRTFLNLTD